MKTLTALFAAGALLSSSVFAGPGPHGEPTTTTRDAQVENKAVVSVPGIVKAHVSSMQRTQPKSQNKVRFIYGPHGNVLVTL